MEGLAELLKHFLSSRLSSASLLVASTVLSFGPKYLNWVPEVPDEWKWAPFGVMIFTAGRCVWWSVTALAKWSGEQIPKLWQAAFPFKIGQATEDEVKVIRLLGDDKCMSLLPLEITGNMIFEEPAAANVAIDSLKQHGIVERDSAFVRLTAKGQEFLRANRQTIGPPRKRTRHDWMG